MDALKRDEVEEIALLARLALEPPEVERMGGELAAILTHMEALAAVDTSGIEPMTNAVPLTLRLRVDEVAPSLSVADALSDAPDSADGCFRVPGIITRDGGA